VEALVGRATALSMMGRTDDAIADARRAVTVRPDYARGHAILGRLLVTARLYRQAMPVLQRALLLEPDSGYAQFSMAWLLAASPHEDQRNGMEALRMAEWLCEVTDYQSARAMDVRAAALAELRRWDVAVLYGERALELLQMQDRAHDPLDLPARREALKRLAEEIRERVAGYRSKDLYRLPLPDSRGAGTP
jgi:tetratricopeptide (TPR) repeat protein